MTQTHPTDLKREFVVVAGIVLWLFVGILFMANSLLSPSDNVLTGAAVGIPEISPPDEFQVSANASSTSCGVVNGSLTLTGNVTANNTCFTLNASNTVLDCAGYKVTYGVLGQNNHEGFAATNLTNITVKNCYIVDGNTTGNNQYPIHLKSGGNHTIFNNTINNTEAYGIYVEDGTNNTNISSNIVRSSSYGLFVYTGSSNNTIQDNLVNGSDLHAFLIHSGVRNNVIRGNTVHALGTSTRGINALGLPTNFELVFEHNTIISNATNPALNVQDVYGSNFTNNTIISNVVDTPAISLSSGTNQSYFTNNNLTTNETVLIDDSTGDTTQNYLVFNTSDGMIKWGDNGTGSFARNLTLNITNNQGFGLGRNIEIAVNMTALNSSAFNGTLNASANITFYTNLTVLNGVSKLTNYTPNASFILSHGTNCNGTGCTILELDGGGATINVSSFSSYAINGTSDITKPTLLLISPVNTTYTDNSSIELNFSATDTNIDTIFYTLDNVTNTTVTTNTTISATEGQQTLYLSVNDTANNVNSTSIQFLIQKFPAITLTSLTAETNTTSLEVPINISADETSMMWYSIDSASNVTLCTACTHRNTTLNITDFGNHSITVYANDTLNNLNSTTFNFNVSVDSDGDGVPDVDDTDDDSDGLADHLDVIVGNNTNINARNFNSINFTVNNSVNITHEFSGLNTVNFTNGTHRFVEFFYNFSHNQSLVLANVTITKQNRTDSTGSIFVRGLNMTEGQRKVIYLDDLDADKTSVCLKDAEIDSISDITSGCDGANETKMGCSAEGTTSGRYTCTDLGAQYKVTGLTHSGAIEVSPDASSSSSSSGGGGSGGGDTGGFAIPSSNNDSAVEGSNLPQSPGNREEEEEAAEDNQGDEGAAENNEKKEAGPQNFAGFAFASDAYGFVAKHTFIMVALLLTIIVAITTTAVWVHHRRPHGHIPFPEPGVVPQKKADVSIGPPPLKEPVAHPQNVLSPIDQRKAQLAGQMKRVSGMIAELKALSKHQRQSRWKQKLHKIKNWKKADPFHTHQMGWINDQLSGLAKVNTTSATPPQKDVNVPTTYINSNTVALPGSASATSAELVLDEITLKLSTIETTLQKKLAQLKDQKL